MNPEVDFVWQEMLADLSKPAALWQLAIVAAACGIAWAINGALRAYVMRNAPENWKLGIGGINRVLFPLSTLIFVLIGKVLLGHWQHVSLLLLASKLLLAMAVIRLVVYAVRYIVAPGGLLKTLENSISSLIWLLLALQLSGLLPELLQVLRSFINLRSQRFKCFANDDCLCARLIPVFLFQRFTHSGQRFHAVAGIKSRRINLMLEPIAARQSGVGQQFSFRLIQQPIKCSDISNFFAARKLTSQGTIITVGAAAHFLYGIA